MSDLDDYCWLVDSSEPWLTQARHWRSDGKSVLNQIENLRKELSPVRARLVIEQVELRERARTKFSAAERMFFTRKSLEQATDETIARYKATRVGAGIRLVDICCGIGGDLLSLADQMRCTGVDRDPVVARFAEANASPYPQAVIKCCDADEFDIAEYDGWHVDPDRRTNGKRTTSLDHCQPNAEWIAKLLVRVPTGAMKLAPATDVDHSILNRASLEWIGHRRECQQLVAWFGDFADGQGRKATVLNADGSATCFVPKSNDQAEPATRLGTHVFEPHPAVLAARLGSELAASQSWRQVAPSIAYYTANGSVGSPLWSCFEVIRELPYRIASIRPLLQDEKIGSLEIKVRGVDVEPNKVRRELKLSGDNAASLLIYPNGNSIYCVIAKRVDFRE